MSRTQSQFSSDVAYADGVLDLSPFDFWPFGGATPPTATRTGKGIIYWAQPVSGTVVYDCPLSTIIYRLGMKDAIAEGFGTSLANIPNPAALVGSPTTQLNVATTPGFSVAMTVASSVLFSVGREVAIDSGANREVAIITSIPNVATIVVNVLKLAHASGINISQGVFYTPAGVTGPPPYSGVTQLTPVTVPRPKGIFIKGMEVRYAPLTAPLTAISVGLSQTVFKTAVAPVVTDILVPAANGLVVNIASPMWVIPVAFPTPQWLLADLSTYILELSFQTGATGTCNFYGVTFYVSFNFN